MKKLIENSNLNINSWLINWGLMKGYLHDGIVETTKFGRFNQWFCILICGFNLIKFTILLFHPKGSKISNLFGDFAYFFGPKIVTNSILVLAMIYVFNLIMLFHFSSKHPKAMFWLNHIEYDQAKHCFKNLGLNQSDSKILIKRMSLLKVTLNCIVYSMISTFGIISLYCVFKYQSSYYLNYIISIITMFPPSYFAINYLFGLLIILYQVSYLLNPFFKLINNCFLKICFYFHLKFHHLNVLEKALLMSSSNVKKLCFTRNVNSLIKNHNTICSLLKYFDDFWRYFLILMIGFYIYIIWFLMYRAFHLKLPLLIDHNI